MCGNYDGKVKTPTFDLYLGVNKWDTGSDRCIKYINKGNYASILIRTHLCFCLVNTGSGTPFISVLEVRPLNNNTYMPKSGSLDLLRRFDCGSTTYKTYRQATFNEHPSGKT